LFPKYIPFNISATNPENLNQKINQLHERQNTKIKRKIISTYKLTNKGQNVPSFIGKQNSSFPLSCGYQESQNLIISKGTQ